MLVLFLPGRLTLNKGRGRTTRTWWFSARDRDVLSGIHFWKFFTRLVRFNFLSSDYTLTIDITYLTEIISTLATIN